MFDPTNNDLKPDDQNSASIALEELAALPSYYAPSVNPAGDQIAFYWDKSGRNELYLLDLNTRRLRQISTGQMPRTVHTRLCWNRSGDQLIFGKDSAGNEQHDLFAINLADGQTVQLTDDPQVQEYPVEFSHDDEWLSVLSNRGGQLNLWKMRSDGSEHQPLTDYPNPVMVGGNWSPAGDWLAYNVNQSDNLLNFDGYLVRPDGSECHRVFRVREGSDDQVGDWHPDGGHIAVTSDVSGVHRPGVLDLNTGRVRWLGSKAEAGIDEVAGRFSRNGGWLLCERNYQAELRTVLYDLETGQRHDLKLPPGQALSSDWVLDDRALLIYLSTEDRRPERGLYWLDTDRYEPLLPADYGSIDPAHFVTGQHLNYPSLDGRSIPALLYLPRHRQTDQPGPAVVIAHGGPTDQFYREFDPFVQVLLDRGYAVLQPNVRGSTGYGVEFRDSALYDWGGGDLDDIEAGVNFLKELPQIDPTRLAIFGGSYGGYMTYSALTRRPGLFKVGIAWVGITDLLRLYEDMPGHFKYYLRQQMGDPLERADLWRDRSPINFAEQLTAQLLMLQGENDPRCPLNQASLFRERLIESGHVENRDFEYVVLSAEGHGSQDVEQKIRVFKLVVDFLGRKL